MDISMDQWILDMLQPLKQRQALSVEESNRVMAGIKAHLFDLPQADQDTFRQCVADIQLIISRNKLIGSLALSFAALEQNIKSQQPPAHERP